MEIWCGSPDFSKLKFEASTGTLLGQEHQYDGDFNNISSNSSADIDDSSKTDKNEAYKDFDENLDDDGDDYDPSVSDEVNNKPHASTKSKLDNIPRLIDNKRKHLKKTVFCSKGIDSN